MTATVNVHEAKPHLSRLPCPSMIRTLWGDPDRFRKRYFPEDLGGRLYLAGNGAVRDATTGYFTEMTANSTISGTSRRPACCCTLFHRKPRGGNGEHEQRHKKRQP